MSAKNAPQGGIVARKRTVNEVYRERNLAVISHAVALHANGQNAGWHVPEDDWPVVWFEIPTTFDPVREYEQVGHHVQPFNEPLLDRSSLPRRAPPGGYDGHTRADRLNRLTEYISSES